MWNCDQMGLQLEVVSGRTLAIRGTKKVITTVQRLNATTHSYTVHIQLKASGSVSPKLPIVLYEPGGVPKKFKEDNAQYTNLQVYWSTSGMMGSEIAKQWMKEVFLQFVDEDSILVLDAWNGYNQMLELPEIAQKKLKIVKLPKKSTSVLQPADVYFNRPFKNFIRKVSNRIRLHNNDFKISIRKNLLALLDMLWFQLKAPRFENLVKYGWYRAGYFTEHPPNFQTPVQYCLGYKGYTKCESDNCPNLCFIRCAHCELHFCFNHGLNHRD